MRRALRIGGVAFAVLAAATADAQAPVQTLYADALAKEQAVRTALADPQPPLAVLKAARTVMADFESIVRQHPASGYGDDALWHAGRLALDAFEIFKDEHEQAAGARLLRALASQYPTSRLAKRVPVVLDETDLPPPPPSQPRQTLAIIKDIRRTVLTDTVRVTIELDREVSFRDERLENPSRVFVDLTSTRAAPPLVDRTIRFESDADLVRQVRVGRQPKGTTRVVLDLGGISAYSVYPLYGPYRLVIDCLRTALPIARAIPNGTAAPHARGAVAYASPLQARNLVVHWTGRLPSTVPVASSTLREARAAEPELLASAITQAGPATPAPPPARNLAGGFSIARQLGLRVSRIVIDPGHGGHDPGAIANGVSEAELVLDIALRLEKLLAKVPGAQVVLTRRSDEYVPLQERTALANREAADLFLSIHANASASAQARGVETYFLNFATSRSAAAVAARENAASGQAMAALPDLVKTIALNNKLDESRDLATYVQRAMITRLKGSNKNVRDLGVKQAPFVVLIGAAMPSVLTEISFLTHAQELKLLRGGTYRQRIAEALHDAIRKYQTSLQSETKIALQ